MGKIVNRVIEGLQWAVKIIEIAVTIQQAVLNGINRMLEDLKEE